MNNWDVRPEITVVFGHPDVADSVVRNAVNFLTHSDAIIEARYMPDKHPKFYVVSGLRPDHLDIVIQSLEDHVLNTNPDEWLEHYTDILIDEEEELWISIAQGIYWGPNCKVQAYYVTI